MSIDHEETAQWWEETAEIDRRNIKASLALGAAGLFLTGAAFMGVESGDVVFGTIGLSLGGGMTYVGYKVALQDINRLIQSKTIAARHDQLAKQEEQA